MQISNRKDLYSIVTALHDALIELHEARGLLADLERGYRDAEDFVPRMKELLDRIEGNVRYAYDELDDCRA